MLDYLASPAYQLALYTFILLLHVILGRLSAAYVMGGGTFVFLLWMAVAGTYGIRISVSWYYYLQLLGAYTVAYLLLMGASWISDKWGPSYNGEGAIILTGPVILGGTITIAQLGFKAVWHAVTSISGL